MVNAIERETVRVIILGTDDGYPKCRPISPVNTLKLAKP